MRVLSVVAVVGSMGGSVGGWESFDRWPVVGQPVLCCGLDSIFQACSSSMGQFGGCVGASVFDPVSWLAVFFNSRILRVCFCCW